MSIRLDITGIVTVLFISLQSSLVAASYIVADFGSDEFDNRDFYIASNIGAEQGPRLILEYGEGEQFNDGVSSNTKTRVFGVSSDPDKRFNLELSGSNWEKNHAVGIRAVTLTLGLNTINWSFSLAPSKRDITLDRLTNAKSYIESNGLGIKLVYYSIKSIVISMDHIRNDYPSKLVLFSDKPILVSRIFSAITLNQVFALELERTSFNIDYSFTDWMLGLNLSRSVSAVDENTSTMQSLYAEYDFNSSWYIGVNLGRSQDDSGQASVLFGSASVGYHW